ncbi:MAG TPA: DinB family protein [Vicinamibacterales bacterium]|jgi:hypothetical protein
MIAPVLVAALGTMFSLLAAAPISQSDRDKLIADLERSRKIFLDAIADVKTEAQWNYKPAPDRWSVAECAAHIVAAEEYFRQNVRDALKSLPLPAAQQSDAGDAFLAKMIRDRSQRFQAPTALEPTGKVKPKAQTITDFEATRAETLKYVRSTQDPLREHGSGTPPSISSAYQMLLMLSGHTERHTAQLLEVKASPGYPHD